MPARSQEYFSFASSTEPERIPDSFHPIEDEVRSAGKDDVAVDERYNGRCGAKWRVSKTFRNHGCFSAVIPAGRVPAQGVRERLVGIRPPDDRGVGKVAPDFGHIACR